jgi:hypothetical protein
MFIVAIIAILCDKKKKNSWFYMLFFITGIITCYFDFLTTEIITLFVPMLLVLCVRKKEGRLGRLKEVIFFVIVSSILWLIGYAFMWLAKWALSGIILNINPREYVEQNMIERIYSYLGDRRGRGFDFFAVKKNFWTLFPFCFATNIISKTWVLAIMAMLLVIIIDWTDLKGKWNLIFYVLIALAPYARYFVLMSHSYTHYLFTYRTQIITIIAVGMIVMDGFNYKLLNKIKRKVGIKK